MVRIQALLALALAFLATAAAAQTIDTSTVYHINGYQVCTANQGVQDSSGNIYMTGNDEQGTITEKWSPAGVHLWTEKIVQPGATFLAVDNSTGTVFVAGKGATQPYVHAISSGGTALWTTALTATSNAVQALCQDSSGNVYCAVPGNSSGFNLDKLNASSGTVAWSLLKKYSGYSSTCLQLAADNSGHLYLVVQMRISNTPRNGAASINPSNGQDLWRRGFVSSSFTLFSSSFTSNVPTQLYVAPNGNAEVIAAGKNNSDGKTLIAFFGFDAVTGNYTNITVQHTAESSSSFTLFSAQDPIGNLFTRYDNYDDGNTQLGLFDPTGAPGFSSVQALAGGNFPLLACPTAGRAVTLNDLGLLELDSSGNTITSSIYTPVFPIPSPGIVNGNAGSFGSVFDGNGDNGLGIYDASGSAIASDYPGGPVNSATSLATTDANGNVYVLTNVDPNGAGHAGGPMVLSRLYPNMARMWSVTFPLDRVGSFGQLSLKYNASTGDLLVVAADFGKGAPTETFVAKCTTSGNVIWTHFDPHENPIQGVEDGLGNVLVASTGPVELEVTSFAAANGAVSWRYVRPGNNSYGASVGVDGNNNVYALGYNSLNTGLIFVKFSSNGNVLYNEASPVASGLGGSAKMVCDSAGNQYIAFLAQTTLYLWKLNAQGAAVFRDYYPALSGGGLGSLLLTPDNSIALTVTGIPQGSSNPDLLTFKIASNGGTLWKNSDQLSTVTAVFASKVAVDSSGNILAFLNESPTSPSGLGFLEKRNGATGQLAWTYTFDTAPGALAHALLNDIAPLPSGKFAVFGQVPDPSGFISADGFGAVMH